MNSLNYLIVSKEISSDSFKNLYKLGHLQMTYLMYIFKTLNNPQELTYHKTQPTTHLAVHNQI